MLSAAMSACAPADFDEVERTREPSTDPCDAAIAGHDAAGCAMGPLDAGASDAGDATADAQPPPADAAGCSKPVCKAGEMQVETAKCGACDTGTRSRVGRCRSDGCGVEKFGDWGSCTGVTAACTPDAVMPCENGDACGQRVCSSSCAWSACQPKMPNGCLMIGPGHTESGTNYRCCGDGRWQYCIPGCVWSSECVACDAKFCEC